jgi:uncharacterized spore protein YtfJ
MLRNLALEREEFTHNVTKKTAEDVKLLNELMAAEKKASAEIEEALLDMVKEIVNKIKGEIDGEKKMREASEDTLLALLEETCGKLNLTAETGPS